MTVRTNTFPAGDATITVRENLGIDRIDSRVIYGKLTYDRASQRDKNRASNFAEWVCRTVSLEGDMGYPWITVDSSEDETQRAYDAWVEWPEALTNAWIGALYLTETATSDPGTQPGEDPKNAAPPQSTIESE